MQYLWQILELAVAFSGLLGVLALISNIQSGESATQKCRDEFLQKHGILL